MDKLKPIIKFNGGNPVALCNRCFVIMCFVSCSDEEGEDCYVREVNDNGKEDYIKTPIGGEIPIYCDKCKHLLSYSINE